MFTLMIKKTLHIKSSWNKNMWNNDKKNENLTCLTQLSLVYINVINIYKEDKYTLNVFSQTLM